VPHFVHAAAATAVKRGLNTKNPHDFQYLGLHSPPHHLPDDPPLVTFTFGPLHPTDATAAAAAVKTGLTVETPHDFDISALIPHRTTCQMTCQDPAPDNKLDTPPYDIHQAFGIKIYEKTISMTASELCP
jgi:hypothetical protein